MTDVRCILTCVRINMGLVIVDTISLSSMIQLYQISSVFTPTLAFTYTTLLTQPIQQNNNSATHATIQTKEPGSER